MRANSRLSTTRSSSRGRPLPQNACARLLAQLAPPAPEHRRSNPPFCGDLIHCHTGASSIATASHVYSADTFRRCPMTPLLAHDEP